MSPHPRSSSSSSGEFGLKAPICPGKPSRCPGSRGQRRRPYASSALVAWHIHADRLVSTRYGRIGLLATNAIDESLQYQSLTWTLSKYSLDFVSTRTPGRRLPAFFVQSRRAGGDDANSPWFPASAWMSPCGEALCGANSYDFNTSFTVHVVSIVTVKCPYTLKRVGSCHEIGIINVEGGSP